MLPRRYSVGVVKIYNLFALPKVTWTVWVGLVQSVEGLGSKN